MCLFISDEGYCVLVLVLGDSGTITISIASLINIAIVDISR